MPSDHGKKVNFDEKSVERRCVCKLHFQDSVFLKCLISYYITLARDEPHVGKHVRSEKLHTLTMFSMLSIT